MSSTSGYTKISDVLEILSVQSIADDNDWNIPNAVEVRNYQREKQIFTDAVHYCMVLLRQSNRITNHKSDILSLEATLTGHEMFERIISVDVKTSVEPEPEVYVPTSEVDGRRMEESEVKQEITETFMSEDRHEVARSVPEESPREEKFADAIANNVSQESEETTTTESQEEAAEDSEKRNSSLPGASAVDDKDFPPSPLSLTSGEDRVNTSVTEKRRSKSHKSNKQHIPLDVKRKVLALAAKHPEWTLRMLQEYGSNHLSCLSQLSQWERHIAIGGTLRDKYEAINNRTYEKFVEARKQSRLVTAEALRQWAIDASKDFYGTRFNFGATRSWFGTFRKLFDIQGSRSSGYYMRGERRTSKSSRSRRKSTTY